MSVLTVTSIPCNSCHTRAEVAALFEPSVEAAVASIRAQIEASQGVVRVRSFNVVLVEVIDHVY